jgi:hypothetical protein
MAQRFNPRGDSTDVAYDMALDPAGNVYVTGYSVGNLSLNWDGATIKYAPRTSFAVSEGASVDQGNSEAMPVAFDLAQNFPNPFTPSTTIRFALPEAGNVKLTLYNLRGEVVRTLIEGEMTAGYYDASFEAGDLASGMYFYRLQAGAFNMTKKMILQK